MNNPAIKRLSRELQEIQSHMDDGIQAMPLKDNLFEWHFTLLGPADSDYANGKYHGRIVFPSDYPFSPPSISFLTPNGRWETDKKICLSVTGFHPEMWQPAWGVRTILLALRDHFTTDDKSAIGYLDYPSATRRDLAQRSLQWTCDMCEYNCKPDEACDSPTSADANSCASDLRVSRNQNSPLQPNLMLISLILLALAVACSYVYIYL